MSIRNLIAPHRAVIGLNAADRDRAIRELATLASKEIGLGADLIAAELLKREALGSTAFGDGVALPHARFSELTKPIGLAARLKRRIAFDAVDGQPVDLILVMLLPTAEPGAVLNTLASVARTLREPGRLDRLRAAPTAEAFYAALTD